MYGCMPDVYNYMLDISTYMKTTILVEKETRENLKHLGRKDQTYDQVVQQAIRITSALNRHASEDNCQHTVKQIAAEALKID